MFIYYCVFVLVFLACRFEAQNIGDGCTYALTGESGTCKTLGQCQQIRKTIREGIEPQVCVAGHSGTVPSVCCPTGESPVVNVKSVTIKTRFNFPDDPFIFPDLEVQEEPKPKPQSGQCPALPESAVRVKKKGQKSWDKCIDLADSVWPCSTSAGLLLYSPKIRVNHCGHVATVLIVGGTKAAPDEFPHMASLGHGNASIEWHCGGSLISERWVLTAAHCLKEKVTHVRLGGVDRSNVPPPDTMFSVEEIVKHPDYKPSKKYNDIALIKLDKNVPFTKQIRPACLPTEEALDVEKAHISGWGATEEGGSNGDSLLKATVYKFDSDKCSKSYPTSRRNLARGIDYNTQLCYGHETLMQDTCQGDSGGPLQISNNANVECTYLVIGITSFGKICGSPGIPAIYTKVSAFVPWIESIVWPDSDHDSEYDYNYS